MIFIVNCNRIVILVIVNYASKLCRGVKANACFVEYLKLIIQSIQGHAMIQWYNDARHTKRRYGANAKYTNDTMMQWYNDAMIQWCNDTMMQWYNDTMIQWYNEYNDTNAMIQWCNDTMMQWYNDAITMMQWYNDTMMQWYIQWCKAY